MGLVLLGYRGSGKSAVGRILARHLGLPMIDTDEKITAKAGMTIKQIFQQQGEPAFRKMESAALREALSAPAAVISTGGGIVLDPANRQLLTQSSCPRVYLRCEPEELFRRIEADPATAATRPNLAGGGIAEVRHLLTQREPLYRLVMTAELDVTHLTEDQAAAAVLELI
jgi:shikimate kinase